MGFPWDFQRFAVLAYSHRFAVLPWVSHGSPVSFPWVSRGSPVVLPWVSHGPPMELTWDFHWFVVLPWGYSVLTGLIRDSYGTRRIPWDFRGTPMGLLWYSHRSPMGLFQSHGSTMELPWDVSTGS